MHFRVLIWMQVSLKIRLCKECVLCFFLFYIIYSLLQNNLFLGLSQRLLFGARQTICITLFCLPHMPKTTICLNITKFLLSFSFDSLFHFIFYFLIFVYQLLQILSSTLLMPFQALYFTFWSISPTIFHSFQGLFSDLFILVTYTLLSKQNNVCECVFTIHYATPFNKSELSTNCKKYDFLFL